jgi:hypothetical protein
MVATVNRIQFLRSQMCVCVCVRVYIYIYTHTHTHILHNIEPLGWQKKYF